VVTQFDMRCVEKIGLIKFDFLGLRTLTTIAAAAQRVREGGQPDFDIDADPVRRPEDLRDARRGRHRGRVPGRVGGMTDLTVKLKPRAFKELIPIVALYRPGPLGSGMVDDYVNRKNGLTRVEYLLPELEELTAETLGVIVYQDQVLQIANRLAGYSLGEADLCAARWARRSPRRWRSSRTASCRARSSAGSTRRRPSRCSR
jgi:DNA polymerase-3 subunit alpha